MKKYTVALMLLAALFLFCSCGKKNVITRTAVEIKGPEGIVCEISGIKISAKSFRLPPGTYIMCLSAPGHRSEYRTVTVPSSGKCVVEAELAPVRAAVLITSSPSGAQVSMDGKSMGITPLVIRDLKQGEYTAYLSMRGHASVPVKFSVTSERPVLAAARMDSNMGTLNITSSPSRARVFIDGTEVGETPCRTERQEGKYTIRLERAGCNPEERSVYVPRRRTARLHVKLGEKPGGITVTTSPAGAELFINGLKRGVTPCTVEALEPGKYKLRLVREGFDPVESVAAVVAGATDKKHFDLSSSTGSVVFNIRPAGVEVFLDGKSLGLSKAMAQGSEATRDFRVDNLAPGRHEIAMFHSLGVPQKQTVTFRIRKNKSTTLKNLTMWIANCEITYFDNTREKGFLHDSQKDYVVFSPEPGVRFRLERSRIKNLVMLKPTPLKR